MKRETEFFGVQFFPCLAVRGREWQSGTTVSSFGFPVSSDQGDKLREARNMKLEADFPRMQTKQEVHWLPSP
jgi:hypothetical protein